MLARIRCKTREKLIDQPLFFGGCFDYWEDFYNTFWHFAANRESGHKGWRRNENIGHFDITHTDLHKL